IFRTHTKDFSLLSFLMHFSSFLKVGRQSRQVLHLESPFTHTQKHTHAHARNHCIDYVTARSLTLLLLSSPFPNQRSPVLASHWCLETSLGDGSSLVVSGVFH